MAQEQKAHLKIKTHRFDPEQEADLLDEQLQFVKLPFRTNLGGKLRLN